MNNHLQHSPFSLKIEEDLKNLTKELKIKDVNRHTIYFDFSIEQGILKYSQDKPIMTVLPLVSLEQYFWIQQELQTSTTQEIFETLLCEKMMDSLTNLRNENYEFLIQHYQELPSHSKLLATMKRIIELEKDEMEVNFKIYMNTFEEKSQLLNQINELSFDQIQSCFELEEKIPHLSEIEIDDFINQIEIAQLDQIEINDDPLSNSNNTQQDIQLEKELPTNQDSPPQLDTKLLEEKIIYQDQNNYHIIKGVNQEQLSISDIQDQISTDEDDEDLQEIFQEFEKKNKIQLLNQQNNTNNNKTTNHNQINQEDNQLMTNNNSIILNRKFKINSDPQEINVGSSQIFDLAMQNYQILAGKYNEILNNVYLTTTTPSQRESLAKTYKATRLQINQENQASTAYRQRKQELSETIGEMTKIAIQAIQVLNSDELCKLWQFEKVESNSLTSALQSFIDNYIQNNEQKLTESSINNAMIDQDQLEQIVSLSFGLAVFGRSKDFKTDESVTDTFFNQIPYVFTNHFLLISRVLDPKWNKRLQNYIKASDYRLLVSNLMRLTLERMRRSLILNKELMIDIESTIRTKQFTEKNETVIRQTVDDAIRKQIDTETKGIKALKLQMRANEESLINDILNIFPGDKDFQQLVQDTEQQFLQNETEKQKRVMYTMFLYYAQQEILSGKSSRVEQTTFQRTMNFCIDLSLLWTDTLEKIIAEYYTSYKNMTKYCYTNVNKEGLTETQSEETINTVLCNIINNILIISSEKESTMLGKSFSEVVKNLANDSPYAMSYYRRGISTVDAQFPYLFRYQVPLEYKSSGDNQFLIDAKKEISTRITNAWNKGKYQDTKQFINDNPDMQQLIKELVQAGMSSTKYRDFKHTPIAGSDSSVQMFNHLIYDTITQLSKLVNPTEDDMKKLDQRLQEKFSIMVENNTGRLILLSENYMSRIKSPDGLSLFNSFLISTILATFRLKAKQLAVIYSIRDQDVAFSQEKVPLSELSQNIEGLNRKCAILAYQNFVRDNINNITIDEGDSLDRFQDQLWQKTSTISANIACWMTTIFECCENQDRTQQSPQSIQFYIQRPHFLTDFIDDYPQLDDSITRIATWTKLAQNELAQTTEEQTRLPVESKEIAKFKRYIYTTECYRLLNCKNHKCTDIQRNITTSEGMEVLPRLGETQLGGGGGWGSFFKGVLNVVGTTVGTYFQQSK